MKFIIGLFIALFLLTGCGGSINAPVPAPTAVRTDLLFAYYGTDCTTQVKETLGHTNLLWIFQNGGFDCTVKNMRESGLPVVMDVGNELWVPQGKKYIPNNIAEQVLADYFDALQRENVLCQIKAITSLDEPDINLANPDDILWANKVIRKVASQYPCMRGVLVAVIYAGTSRLYHIDDFDIVGFDNYSRGSGIFSSGGDYAYMKSKLKPNQKTLIVAGGSFGQDPVPFSHFAQDNAEVWAMVAFIYFDIDGMTGIKNMPSSHLYCLVGEQAKTPGITGACL